jgi:hypothetical protein
VRERGARDGLHAGVATVVVERKRGPPPRAMPDRVPAALLQRHRHASEPLDQPAGRASSSSRRRSARMDGGDAARIRSARTSPTPKFARATSSSPEALQRLHDALAQLESAAGQDTWRDTKAAAAYLAMKPNALHELASARAIPSEQPVPGGKQWFKRSDLDARRRERLSPNCFDSRLAGPPARQTAAAQRAALREALEERN